MSKIIIDLENKTVSDGYHTFEELYEHRCLLFIAWMVSDGCPGETFWIKDHHDGWDLIVTHLKGKQISYHVPDKYRPYYSSLKCLPRFEHVFDGHTSSDVINRLERWLGNEPK